MTAEMRMTEILNNMHCCAKDLYRRDEMLPEMNGLEKEMINLTFNQDHADQGGLWIRDVEDQKTGYSIMWSFPTEASGPNWMR